MSIYTATQLTEKVLKVFNDQLGVRVQPHHTLREDLGTDSLDIIEIIMTLEDDFEIIIGDEEFDSVKTVDQVISLIAERVGVSA